VSPAVALMNALSQRFQALELRLAGGDLTGIADLALELRTVLDGSPGLFAREPQQEAYAGQLARLDAAARELGALATARNLPGAGQALEELRASCVSCHVRFRSNNDVRGHYPARGNTILGTTALTDIDGEPRENRAWVLAFLESEPLDPPHVHARANPRISQSGRRFTPRVLPVTVGTEVEFPNDDTIFHNVFSLSNTAPFDLGAYQPGMSSSVRMERTGLVKVYCNIHPDMAASIVVLDNPWFALTDEGGTFVICDVPDGDYVLRGWNDMGAEARVPIALRGGALHEANLELRETRRSLAHTNKRGNPYPGRYR
jgi:plastocyanin